MVDYKALIELSLLWVPHFLARRRALLKDLNPNTTSVSKAKGFLVSRWNIRKHTNVCKPLELWGVRVIYWVEQITHRAITKQEGLSDSNYACIKAQDKTRIKHIRTRTQSLQRKVKIQELTDLQDNFRSSREDSTRLLTPDRASPVSYLVFYAKTMYSSYAWPRINCSTHTAKSNHR
jgi:hypothetical protein